MCSFLESNFNIFDLKIFSKWKLKKSGTIKWKWKKNWLKELFLPIPGSMVFFWTCVHDKSLLKTHFHPKSTQLRIFLLCYEQIVSTDTPKTSFDDNLTKETCKNICQCIRNCAPKNIETYFFVEFIWLIRRKFGCFGYIFLLIKDITRG